MKTYFAFCFIYSNPTTKYVVIAKILVDSLSCTLEKYGEFIETYLYWEKPFLNNNLEKDSVEEEKLNGYDVSKVYNVIFYHTLYVVLSPFIGLKEILLAGKHALTRDFGWFLRNDQIRNINHVQNRF